MRDGLALSYWLSEVERENDRLKSATVTLVDATGYRLPTEAEWEYACLAGTTTAFHFGTH